MMHTCGEVDLWSHSVLLPLQTAVSLTLALRFLLQSQRSLLLQVIVATCLGCSVTLVPRTTGYPSSGLNSSASLVAGVIASRYMVALYVPFLFNGFGSVPHKLRPGPLTLDPVQYCGADFFHMVHQPTQHVGCNKFQPWN